MHITAFFTVQNSDAAVHQVNLNIGVIYEIWQAFSTQFTPTGAQSLGYR